MDMTVQTDAGQLVATVQRTGGGRLPVRWRVYWSLMADRLGAPGLPLYDSRQAARAAVLTWACRQGLMVRTTPAR
jgi:hypothetical protein